MKYLILFLILLGCEEPKTMVKCEPPYYSGPVIRAGTTNGGGTYLTVADKVMYVYPASVKCEVTRIYK